LLALREPLPDGEADAARRLGAVEQALAGETGAAGAAGEEEAYLQARAAEIAAGDRLREAAADLQGLPDGATLSRRLTVARRELQGVERACLDAGRLLGLDGPDADAVLCAVPPALAAGQQRSHQLAEATGQRNALHARRLDVERLGLDYKHQLQECRVNLQQDEEEALVARRVSLDAERETVAAEGARLYAGVVAGVREWGEGAGAGQGALLLEMGASGVAGDGREAGNGVAVADALPDVAGLRRDLGQRYDRLQGEVAVLERQAQAGAEAEAGLQEAKGRLAEREDELGAALAAAGAAPEWATAGLAATAAEAGRRTAAAEAELAALDEPVVQAQEHFLQKELWGTEEVLRTLAQGAERQVGELLDLARQLGHEAPDTVAGEAETAPAEPGDGVAEAAGAESGDGDGEAATARASGAAVATWLREACPEVTGDLPSLDAVEEALDALGQREWEGQRSVQEARLLLGDEAPLSVAEAEEALATATLDLAARRRAQDILGQTRQRMINKVLPDTMRNMCLLLPLLTAGRYRYAELTPDYRLQVWDERKHGYVEKTLYSGGTQDQFSLALRLGFALAALPRELGTSPGFLFLDEPLSSFDHDRTAALIDLLTQGQIATFFQQVFLISHSQAFDPASFTHHIVMEDGAVAAGTLEGPSGP
ncbi:MAG TPA: hypothetical protein VHQ00_14805, partial [Chloroflexota bacterium]|nr:hypothetical protein [Chloroflexota bacterium]